MAGLMLLVLNLIHHADEWSQWMRETTRDLERATRGKATWNGNELRGFDGLGYCVVGLVNVGAQRYLAGFSGGKETFRIGPTIAESLDDLQFAFHQPSGVFAVLLPNRTLARADCRLGEVWSGRVWPKDTRLCAGMTYTKFVVREGGGGLVAVDARDGMPDNTLPLGDDLCAPRDDVLRAVPDRVSGYEVLAKAAQPLDSSFLFLVVAKPEDPDELLLVGYDHLGGTRTRQLWLSKVTKDGEKAEPTKPHIAVTSRRVMVYYEAAPKRPRLVCFDETQGDREWERDLPVGSAVSGMVGSGRWLLVLRDNQFEVHRAETGEVYEERTRRPGN